MKNYSYKGYKIWITKLPSGKYTWEVTEDFSIQSWSERDMKNVVKGYKTAEAAKVDAIKDINKWIKEDKYGGWFE